MLTLEDEWMIKIDDGEMAVFFVIQFYMTECKIILDKGHKLGTYFFYELPSLV